MKIVACEGKHSKNATRQAAQKAGASTSRTAANFQGSGDAIGVEDDRSDEETA